MKDTTTGSYSIFLESLVAVLDIPGSVIIVLGEGEGRNSCSDRISSFKGYIPVDRKPVSAIEGVASFNPASLKDPTKRDLVYFPLS